MDLLSPTMMMALFQAVLLIAGVFGIYWAMSRKPDEDAPEPEHEDFWFEALGKFSGTHVLRFLQKNRYHGFQRQTQTLDLTIAFVDVQGFRNPVANDQEGLLKTQNLYVESVCREAEAEGGNVHHLAGDSMMVIFGLGEPADHAAKAVRFARNLRGKLADLTQELAFPVRLSVGINSGPVLQQISGSGTRLFMSFLGETVNFAARLERLNSKRESLLAVSQETARKAGSGNFRFRELATLARMGVRDPEQVFTLEGWPFQEGSADAPGG